MEYKLELSVFRFDALSDYLPYYKKHFITIDSKKSVLDLLSLIKDQDPSFEFSKGKFAALKINHKALYTKVRIKEIVEHFGQTLTIEPLSTKRATKDMIINHQDFDQSFSLLAPYVEAKDKPLFQNYLIYHYASNVHEFVENFQAEALFAFAYDMIEKYPEAKKKILSIIADEHKGIFLHVRLCNKIYPCAKEVEQKIASLKNMILKELPNINPLVQKLSHQLASL